MRKHIILLIFISSWALSNSCQKDPQKYLENQRSSIFMVSALPDSLPADGKSTLLITASLSPTTADYKTVLFTTSQGTFADNDSVKFTTNATLANKKLIASAYLMAGIEETDRVLVKISVPRIDTTVYIKFYTARPDSIHIESATVIVARNYNNQIPLSTYLFRKSGKATLHQSASFRAVKADGTSIGSFIGISPDGSDSSGLIKSTFVTLDSVYTGNVHIISTVQGATKLLKDTVTLLIKP